jgi:hypothetical protein
MVCLAFLVLASLTFTPLVIPAGKSTPSLGSLPYTLWVGILQFGLFILLTFIGTRVHPANEEDEA